MEVLGVDLSKNMIDIGKQRAKEFKDDKVTNCKKLIYSMSKYILGSYNEVYIVLFRIAPIFLH